MAEHPHNPFDLGVIRKIIEQGAANTFKGVGNGDVDWFLRDTNISNTTNTDSSNTNNTNSNTTNPNNTNTNNNSNSLQPLSQSSLPSASSAASQPAAVSPSKNAPTAHLLATISNTNPHYETKTRPSVAPVLGEPALPHKAQNGALPSSANSAIAANSANSASSSNSAPLLRSRRSSAASILTNGSAHTAGSVGSSGGFFSKLKGRLLKTDGSGASGATSPPMPQANGHALSPKSSSQPAGPVPVFKDAYRLTRVSTDVRDSDQRLPHNPLARTLSVPNSFSSDSSTDPRLEEYVSFYKQRLLRRKSSISRKSSIDYGSFNDAKRASISELLPQPQPSAPANSLLGNIEGLHSQNAPPCDKSLPPPSKFSFLKRKSVSLDTPAQSMQGTASVASSAPSNLSGSDISSVNIPPQLSKVRPLKRVAFHALTFLIDPPQQIPSRTPRKGNVEVLASGLLKINPLTEAEKLAMEKSLLGQGGGLVVGGTGALAYLKKDGSEPAKKEDEDEEDEDEEEEEEEEEETEEEDEKVDKHAKLLGIDKAIIMPRSECSYSVPVKKMALDLMYTRICHLREILPIPALLKQIPAGSLAPIPLLQLRNPTPTLVEIQTFADFLRIAPIVCVSLDGVSLTFEQFKILLSAMAAKKQLEKLSLRNTPIDHEGWSLLCWFLSRNTVLTKLDITQCPSLSINLLKKKKKKPSDKASPYESDVARMNCNKDNRSDMDWELFTATMIARGGIEELILTGCCITDTAVFENLIKLAMLIKTSRLGLAYNKLSTTQFKIITEHWNFQPFARGLDLGYNDFSSLQYLLLLLNQRKDPMFDENMKNSTLQFLSLNATNLRFSEAFKEVNETILMRYPNLKYLDLSNNPKLFGHLPLHSEKEKQIEKGASKLANSHSIDSEASTTSSGGSTNTTGDHSEVSVSKLSQDAIVSYFTSKFPLYPKLIRLHLENNSLSSNSIISIAKTLPFCKNLGYFSLHGNELDLAAAAALLQGVENSKTLITLDCDFESLPVFFKEKIGLYTMRNMERILYASKKHKMPEEVALLETTSDNTSIGLDDKSGITTTLTEQLNEILSRKANDRLDLEDPSVKKFIEKARKIRLDLRSTMDELYRMQLKNELTLEGKEMLIRFVFIESSIERGLQLIDPSLTNTKDLMIKDTVNRLTAENERTAVETREENRENGVQHGNRMLLPTRPAPGGGSGSSPLISRTSSKTNLSSLDKNEGNALKLKKLHDNLVEQEPGKSNEDEFLDSMENLSGEEIRKTLLNADLTDLDKIISYLGELKDHKISLESVFNQNSILKDEHFEEDSMQQKLEKLQATLMRLAESRSGLDDETQEARPASSVSADSASVPVPASASAPGSSLAPVPADTAAASNGQSAVKTGSSSTTGTDSAAQAPNDAAEAATEDPESIKATYDRLLTEFERRMNI